MTPNSRPYERSRSRRLEERRVALLEERERLVRRVLRVEAEDEPALGLDLLVRLLEQRHLLAARIAPRGPHVEDDDLALVVGERALAAGVQPGQRRDRRSRPRALGDGLVQRRVRPLRDEPVREQADEGRGGDGDRPEDAQTHAARVSASSTLLADAGVVQWLRRWLPKPKMGVRFPSPAPIAARRRASGAPRARSRSRSRCGPASTTDPPARYPRAARVPASSVPPFGVAGINWPCVASPRLRLR